MDTILQVLITAVAFFIGSKILSGVEVKSFVYAIIIALVMAGLNFTIGTFLKVLSLGVLSLGLFTIILDAVLILIADYFLDGFKVKSFLWALALALVVGLASGIMGSVVF